VTSWPGWGLGHLRSSASTITSLPSLILSRTGLAPTAVAGTASKPGADGGLTPRARARGAPVKSQNGHRATRRTVIVAGVANIVVGLAKLAVGIISGSSAMLAEAAHSAADTLNQGFLLTSLHQAERPADRDHPFGHGQERYFWSLLAAFGIFIAGAGFSIFEGLLGPHPRPRREAPCRLRDLGRRIRRRRHLVRPRLLAAPRRSPTSPRGSPRPRESSPDITVKVTLFEDSAAVVGLILAALGVGLGQLTGSPAWDGAASIAIGVLLVAVAIKLGMDSKELLIGRAADPGVQQLIREEIESLPGVDALLELRTMHMGPDSLIVAAGVALNDDLGADQTEDLADEIDCRLSEKLPLQLNVFIDPTQTRQTPQPEAARSPGRDAAGARATP
jgi:divalent metal cation (Fe/Co/Zn/Cd) transporter